MGIRRTGVISAIPTWLLLAWVLLTCSTAQATPIELTGNTSFYLWDQPGEQELDQSLSLWVQPQSDMRFRLSGRTNLLMDRSQQTWRVDEASLQWTPSSNLLLQLGRSYPTVGASTGRLDGAELRLRTSSGLATSLFAGLSGKHYRRGNESYGDHWKVGAGLSYRSLPHVRADLYALHEGFQSRSFRELAGWSFYAYPGTGLSLSSFGRLDLKNQEIAYANARADYEISPGIRVSAEVYRSQPRVPGETEDLLLPSYQEISGGLDWRVSRKWRVRAKAGKVSTQEENGTSLRAYLRWSPSALSLSGTFYRYALGTTTRRLLSGQLRYRLREGLALRGEYRQFHYEYNQGTTAYQAHTFGGGLDLQLISIWMLSVEGEHSWRDRGHQSDTRIYTTLGYRFGSLR